MIKKSKKVVVSNGYRRRSSWFMQEGSQMPEEVKVWTKWTLKMAGF